VPDSEPSKISVSSEPKSTDFRTLQGSTPDRAFGGTDPKPGLITAVAVADAHLTLEEGHAAPPLLGKEAGQNLRPGFMVLIYASD
jgi:hypothetical protein